MTAKELREAAEAVLKFTFHETPPDHPFHEIYEVSRKRERLLANYILANVEEDGEDEPTPSWIEGNFPVSETGNGFYRIGGLYFTYSGASWHCCRHRTTQSVICPITTRSQFRALCQGLGIEPQKNIGKKDKLTVDVLSHIR